MDFDDEEQRNTQADGQIISPNVGMEFNSEVDAYTFYNKYWGFVGFGVSRDWVNTNKAKNIITSRRFDCSKEGFRILKNQNVEVRHPHKNTRTGCKAHLVISLQNNNRYLVTSFSDEHNHAFVAPSQSHMIRSQRKVSLVQGIEASLAMHSGIKQKQVFEFMSREVGVRENLGFLRTDLKNYLFAKRQKDMELGEAGSLYYYFQKKQSENPDFHYAIQIDEDNQIANIFWTDAKTRADYAKYGDVFVFDTIFRTNKESRPFAPFVGVNNHKETVVFGAALMYDETIESFKWVFKSFLQAMSGKKPKTILTDQDAAMASSIREVFPDTYHRLCVWHLHKNALKHLSHVFRNSKSFANDFKRCIYDFEVEEDFLNAWNDLLVNYDLVQNSWLEGIFKERRKWALVYGRHTFCADMKSTQLSESFNSTLKRYLNSKLNVLEFFNHFERVLDDVRYNELTSNKDMTQKIPILKIDAILLNQARDIYTAKVFDWFQIEFLKIANLVVCHVEEDEARTIYKIGIYGKSREHTVIFDALNDIISCSCMKFEFVGILCSHILKVLDRRDIKSIPVKYIMERWTKHASSVATSPCPITNESLDPKLEKMAWYKDLCRESVTISGMAVETREDYEYFRAILQEARSRFQRQLKSATTSITPPPDIIIEEGIDITQVKGLKKKQGGVRGGSRLKSGLEVKAKKPKKRISKVQSPLPPSSQLEGIELLHNTGSNFINPTCYQVPNSIVGQDYFGTPHQSQMLFQENNIFSSQSQWPMLSQENNIYPSQSQLLQMISRGAQGDGTNGAPINLN